MSECIFCKIVNGTLPAARVYEDEKCIGILDINPVTQGHSLLMPRDHFATLEDVPEALLRDLSAALKKMVAAVKKGMNAEGINVLVNNGRCAGQLVAHLHFHVIPRKTTDGVSFHWSPRTYGAGELDSVAQKIRGAAR